MFVVLWECPTYGSWEFGCVVFLDHYGVSCKENGDVAEWSKALHANKVGPLVISGSQLHGFESTEEQN